MDKISAAAKFVLSVVTYYVKPTPPDFVLTSATTWTLDADETDVTPDIIGWLATSKTGMTTDMPLCAYGKRLVLRYTYRGAGPYACYYDAEESVEFPPLSKLKSADDDATKITKCLDTCVSVAEVLRDEEELADVSDEATAFAGPDGNWHGRSLVDRTMDMHMFYKGLKTGDIVSVSFANGETTEIQI